jgi:hypothetical protein
VPGISDLQVTTRSGPKLTGYCVETNQASLVLAKHGTKMEIARTDIQRIRLAPKCCGTLRDWPGDALEVINWPSAMAATRLSKKRRLADVVLCAPFTVAYAAILLPVSGLGSIQHRIHDRKVDLQIQ